MLLSDYLKLNNMKYISRRVGDQIDITLLNDDETAIEGAQVYHAQFVENMSDSDLENIVIDASNDYLAKKAEMDAILASKEAQKTLADSVEGNLSLGTIKIIPS